MFEYIDFLHFDFRVNLSNSRHYYYNATTIVVCLFF